MNVDVYLYLHRTQYYRLLEECIGLIVLHRCGLDPDFRYGRQLQLDTDSVLKQLDQMADAERRLDIANIAKKENEALANSLQSKCNSLNLEIDSLRLQVQVQLLVQPQLHVHV